MAKNDTLLLDGIIDDRVVNSLPSEKRDEAFEYLAFQQILKDYDFSHDEIMSGVVDGRDDGGIDGIYIIVNGNLLLDPDSFFWPRQKAHLAIILITCKHHDTFRQAPLDNLVATCSEFFDLSISENDLCGSYSSRLKRVRSRIISAYRKLSPKLSSFEINLAYASRGDSQTVGDSISSRAHQRTSNIKELFGDVDSEFQFFGAAELVNAYRKAQVRTHELPFIESLAMNDQYAVLCNLEDYADFVSDESGNLRRYMFESNIRAFMGLNRVNEDIKNTLSADVTPNFWWLNNGVTILASAASVTGKSIQITEPQIVNGLQTSESIFRHFSDGGNDPQKRSLLVKVLVTSDAATRDAVIRSTNNQTNVELQSLHATDKVQRDIEDYLRHGGLFYERRKNFYVEQGVHPRDVITPMYLAGGLVSLVLKSPRSAAGLKSKFMRDRPSYERVFSEKYPIEVWPNIVLILRRVDSVLETHRLKGFASGERYRSSWRYLAALVAVSRALNKFSFSPTQLASFDHDSLSDKIIKESVELIFIEANHKLASKLSRKRQFVVDVCKSASSKFGIEDHQVVERGSPFSFAGLLNADFLQNVNAALPPQPWPPGVHRDVADTLRCRAELVSAAIQHLIEDGVRNQQRDGIVYDSDGNVVAVDTSRAQIPTYQNGEKPTQQN